VTNLPPLNGISSRDSKKEEARRREINKNIVIEVGRLSSSFVDRCETFNLFFDDCWSLHHNELGGTKTSTMWEGR
jgi:hypothetical protein